MKKLLRFAYISCVIFLGFVFFGAGMSKLYANHQFIGLMGTVWLEEKLVQYDLGLFARFVAYSQVTTGFLLLTFRFRTLGAVMLVPMLANILMITISQHWKGTPYVVSVFILQNMYLLWYDRAILLPLITGENSAETGQNKRDLKGNLLFLAAYLLVLLSVPLSFVFLEASWLIALVALFMGFFSKELDKPKPTKLVL